jgi:hypothetical protein
MPQFDFDFIFGELRGRLHLFQDRNLAESASTFLDRLLDVHGLILLPVVLAVGREFENSLNAEQPSAGLHPLVDRVLAEWDKVADPHMTKALKLLSSSAVVQSWAAFEFYAGSLWTSVVDRYPASLGETAVDWVVRRGKANDWLLERIDHARRAGKAGRFGRLLRNAAEFTGVAGIADAYQSVFQGLTFSESLTNSLRYVQAARNAILHNGNRIDKKFQRITNLKFFRGREFAVLPSNVEALLCVVADCGVSITEGVDRWLMSHVQAPPPVIQ